MDKQSKTLEIVRRIGAPRAEKIRISGILHSPELALLTVLLPADDGSSSATFLSLLGAYRINVRFISKYEDAAGNAVLNVGVEANVVEVTPVDLFQQERASIGIKEFSYRPDVRVISIYPHKEQPQVAKQLFATLRLNGIEPLAANNTSSVISCVICGQYLQQALSCLEQVFELP
ncbi:MAG: hypothetical protein ACLFVT_00120 [Syntrophobacteria bacterium]